MRAHPQINVLAVSSFYRTAPVGMVDQDWFINGALLCETTLMPEELLGVVRGIENDFGRLRKIRWGPRTLDLDILAFDDESMELPDLTVPHPRLHERRFVLLPLAEIVPSWTHPVLKLSIPEMLDRICGLDDQKVERIEIS